MTRKFWLQTLILTAYIFTFALFFFGGVGGTICLILVAFATGMFWLLALVPVAMFVTALLFRLAVLFPILSYDLDNG